MIDEAIADAGVLRGPVARRDVVAARLALAALLIVGAPIFICRAPGLDATLYDMAARSVLRGGVHYREIFDTNLPGMVWLHVLVRGAFGWSSEAIRAVDFAVVALIVWLLVGWARRLGLSTT